MLLCTITLFARAAKAFGLKINIEKTEVVYQPVPGCQDVGDPILIQDEELAQVSRFKYLGLTIGDNNKLDAELEV